MLDRKKDGDPVEVKVPAPDGEPRRIPVVYYEKVRCPYCQTTKVVQYGADGRVKYYRCTRCVPRNGRGDWCRFKAIERDR